MNQTSADVMVFPEVRVVEASAGSGKTYALAARYVILALKMANEGRDNPLRFILALTFTNKAAIEMKLRILDFIKRIALGRIDPALDQTVLIPLGISRERSVELAGILMAGIIRHYNYFQVETIDKFINTLLVSCGAQSGLTSAFAIRTDSREYIARALDDLIDSAAGDGAVRSYFSDFISNYLHVESRMEWMPKEAVFQAMRGLFMIENTFALPFARGGVSPEDIIREKKRVLSDLTRFQVDMPEGMNGTFVKSLAKFLDGKRQSFRFNDLSSYFSRPDMPVNKGADFTSGQVDLWEKAQTGFVRAAELEVNHLYDPYIRIYHLLRARLLEDCAREDILFLEELNARTKVLFEGGLAVPDIFYRLAVRYRHYLIDEFQDTSVLQWDNLRLLPEDAIASGGTLFYVGDKKQAIYGFRGGEARLFDDLKSCYQAYNVREIALSVNWRSLPAVVEFNNKVFSVQSLERFALSLGVDSKGNKKDTAVSFSQEDLGRLRSIFHSSTQSPARADGEGVVRVERIECAAVLDETLDLVRSRIIALLRSLKDRGYDWKDVALLLRSNGEVEEVARWLLESGIPVRSERMSNVRENAWAQEVVSFLHFLNIPADDFAFAQFISGDIFSRASGLPAGDIDDFILRWRTNKNRVGKTECLSARFQQQYPALWQEFIADFLANAGTCPLYELLVSFYRRTAALVRCVDGQAYLMRLLELIKEKEKDFPDLAGFLEHYEALEGETLYVKGPGGDAVELLTVHKAKGLEFPVTIVPLLTMKPKVSGSGEGKAHNYTPVVEDGAVNLLRLTQYYRRYSARADELYSREYLRSVMAELNMIYVALTRAENELYVFIPSRAGRSVNPALALIPEDCYSLGQPQPVRMRRKDEGGPVRSLLPSDCRDWMEYLQDEFTLADTVSLRYERQQGVMRHAVLAGIGRLDAGVDLRRVMKSAVCCAGYSPREGLLDEMELFVTHEKIRPFFFTSADVLCEKSFLLSDGAERRIDRILVFEDQVWAIDFKLTAFVEKAREQLRGYLHVLADVYPSRMVRGFLVSISDASVEEVVL